MHCKSRTLLTLTVKQKLYKQQRGHIYNQKDFVTTNINNRNEGIFFGFHQHLEDVLTIANGLFFLLWVTKNMSRTVAYCDSKSG